MSTWEQYMRDLLAQHEPSDDDLLKHGGLDAYGHLTWTVGNEDWLACFDAILSPEGERIAYHVVVNCESSGFTDTLDQGVIDIKYADAILNIKELPYHWADICAENYADYPEYKQPNFKETEECYASWSAHIDSLLRKAKHG